MSSLKRERKNVQVTCWNSELKLERWEWSSGYLLWWFTPSWQLSSLQLLVGWYQGENWKGKSVKTSGWDKDRLIRKKEEGGRQQQRKTKPRNTSDVKSAVADCQTWCHMAWHIPFVSWGQLSWLRPLPASCAPPACSLAGQCEEQKRPWCCVRAAQQKLKHPWVVSTVFGTNPKHSNMQATMEKINSVPAKTSTSV